MNSLEQAAKISGENQKRDREKALEYISEKEGKTIVDWARLFQKKAELSYSGRGIFEQIWDASLEVLKEKNVLVYPQEKSFFIMGDGIDLSPTTSWKTTLYFTDEEEAKKYTLAKYKNALYGVSICELKRNAVNKQST